MRASKKMDALRAERDELFVELVNAAGMVESSAGIYGAVPDGAAVMAAMRRTLERCSAFFVKEGETVMKELQRAKRAS